MSTVSLSTRSSRHSSTFGLLTCVQLLLKPESLLSVYSTIQISRTLRVILVHLTANGGSRKPTRRHSQPRHVRQPMRSSLHCVITFLHVRYLRINAYRRPRTIASHHKSVPAARVCIDRASSVHMRKKGARCGPRSRSSSSIPIRLVVVAMAT
jgi:hypothetical protein